MLDKIFQVLFDCWSYDIEVFSNWWMYAPLCIPALLYLIFFFVKWSVLTAPVWLPITIILNRVSLFRIKVKS